MKITEIKDIYHAKAEFAAKSIKICGWIRTIRSSKNFGFIELNDGSFFKNIQIVFENHLENYEQITKAGIATSLSVTGKLELTPDARQPFEIKAESIVIEGTAEVDYPLQKKRHTFEYLRTIAHLRPRTNTFSAVFRIRSLAAHAIHCYLQDHGFVYVHTPIITGSDCEGAGEMFRVSTLPAARPPLTEAGEVDYSQDFFGRETNLTVSGQLAVEAYVMAFRKVYTFGPTFRAENSNTARHAAEFWMIEPEIAFADLSDNMDLAEGLMKYVINYIMEKAPEELEFFNNFVDKGLLARLQHLTASKFEHVTYTAAIEILKAADKVFNFPVEWGIDLQTEHERFLTEDHFKRPVFVTDYPKDIKAFYMRMNDDGKTVAAMDLLVPGVGEIIGGSQREERHDLLEKRIAEMGLNKADYWWYLDLRKYGGTKHAGFGLGFERVIMYLTGMQNIRDVISYPRTPNSAEF
ncbi:MAG: asparagine--tRNA ligase [Candidatus Cloacimonetes bacterium]|nr:asparagine--tRNA ligase [Candidatus Cloacimonadota bacterium]